MDRFNDQDFIDFLESFNEGVFVDEDGIEHKFHDSLTELSRSDSKPYDALVTCKVPMYGLDWIVKASKKWRDSSKKCKRNPKLCKHKFPKTIDAMYCKKGEHGNLVLHIIEFKFIPSESNQDKLNNLLDDIIDKDNQYNLKKSKNPNDKNNKRCFDKKFVDDFKSIKRSYVDDIENSLQLKPYEAIFIVLPELYDEFCEKNPEICKKDFKGYLYNMEKYYWVCIDSGLKNGDHLHLQAKHYEKYYKRMEPVIFKEANAKTKKDFEKNLKENILKEVTC